MELHPRVKEQRPKSRCSHGGNRARLANDALVAKSNALVQPVVGQSLRNSEFKQPCFLSSGSPWGLPGAGGVCSMLH